MRKPFPAPEIEGSVSELAALGSKVEPSPELVSVVADAQSVYRHWDKIRRIAAEKGVNPHAAWAVIRLMRQAALKPTPLRGSSGEPVKFSIPSPVQHEIMMIDQHLAGQIGIGPDLNLGEEKDRFVATSFMEEAIASSMLEGAATTVRVAKEMLRTGRRPRTTGERMVANNYRAIGFVRDNLKRSLTPELLLELQGLLTKDTLERPDECGRFRSPGERVVVEDAYGELLHDPPPAEELAERLKRLCAFANQPPLAGDGAFIHPFVRAVLLHFQIGYDHPFCDGNGRTARMVFYWSMLRQGYWLFEFLPISRLIYKSPAKYGQAFLYTETDRFDATYFLVYNARIVGQARTELREYIASKQRELADARTLFKREEELNPRQRELLMHAIRNPAAVYTIEGHQRSQGVAYATARSDLLSLVEKGYLTLGRSGRRMEFSEGRKVISARRRM